MPERLRIASLFRGGASSSTEPTLAIDPLADLLLSLVAIVVLAVIVILPAVQRDGARSHAPRQPAASAPSHQVFRLAGRTIEPLVATSQGLRTGPAPEDIVAVDRILDDGALAARLQRMRDEGATLLLVIDPDGAEAAFQFEAVASLHGPPRIRQVRRDPACTHLRSATLARDCAARSDRAGDAMP